MTQVPYERKFNFFFCWGGGHVRFVAFGPQVLREYLIKS